MKTCKKCHQTFKNREFGSENHLDRHTPYWIHDKVKLSGADQIRLLLKHWAGGWNKFLKEQIKKDRYDYDKAVKLQKFEQQNKIEFVICGDKIVSYKSLETTTQGERLAD